ncbi:MAG: type II secretion system F family protein [Patescibacteria group bacterium]
MEFRYQARTRLGTIESGTVEAPGRDAAIDALQRSGFIILEVKDAAALPAWARGISFKRGVSKKDVVIFSRQISTLFQAKVPLIEALRTMVEQTGNQRFKDALLDTAKDVDAGAPLSRALAAHRNIFSDFYVSMVRSGEASGKLEEVFTYLADGLEREYDVTHKIKGAMTYPAFIIFGFGAVVFVMMVWVVPNLTSILKETGAEMPFLTTIVIGVSDAFAAYWWLILLVLALAVAGLWYGARTPQGRIMWDRAQLHIPIIGKMLQKYYLARFADSLSVLIQGGLPIVQALEITADVVRNSVYRTILLDTVEQVKKGNTISSVLRTKKEIPIMVTQMVFVGEESGRLDSTLKSASLFYQKEVAVVLDNVITLIEPFLILALGVGVAILLVAILMPMYNIATNF